MQCYRRGESGTWSSNFKASAHEITRLKAVIDSSSIAEQSNLDDWIEPKTSKARVCWFSADDASQLQVGNRFKCPGNRCTGSCPGKSRFAEAKGQWSHNKSRKV